MILALLLQNQISGDAVIRGKTADSEIVITTTSRVAGAIHSLKWRGKEFIDSTDHGRQLQSAANFDAGSPITDETYNPTEAGSRRDGAGPTSTSLLSYLEAKGNRLVTNTAMAFWLSPGEASGRNVAKNTTARSNWRLTKHVTIGVMGRPQLIEYMVQFGGHPNEKQKFGVFETLTGYMPADFSSFFRFDLKTSKLEALNDGPGEQSDPIVFSTPTGDFALGVFSPDPSPKGYGRWRFGAERVVKWNCVFRVKDPSPTDWHAYIHYLAVGTREQVRRELELVAQVWK